MVFAANLKGWPKVFDLNDLVSEYFETDRILHLTAIKPIRCRTTEQGYALGAKAANLMQSSFGGERGYFITDYSKIIIEPDFISEYAAEIKKIFDTHLYPGGFARYGFEITRVTARLGHEIYLGGSANIFNTKEEAFNFIYGLIAQKAISPAEDLVTVPVKVLNRQDRR